MFKWSVKYLMEMNLRGSVVWAKMVKIINFLFFAQKVSSGMWALRPKFLGGFAALEPLPPKWGQIENEEENGKNILYIL